MTRVKMLSKCGFCGCNFTPEWYNDLNTILTIAVHTAG